MSENKLQRIGLLGGSFNPPHEGHRAISLYALDALALDHIWWLVTPGNPLKAQSDYAAYETRLVRAKSVSDHRQITISDFERQQNIQYTADTLTALRRTYPAYQFVWLMGADSLANFHQWRDWQHIFHTMPIAVFNRPGYDRAALASPAAQRFAHMRLDEKTAPILAGSSPPSWIFFHKPQYTQSSTAIRSARPDWHQKR